MGKYYKKKRSMHGRRKAKLGAIVTGRDGKKYVAVDWKKIGSNGHYCLIPMTDNFRRFGPARWYPSDFITDVAGLSKRAAVQTYRANRWLAENMGRTCKCQCCPHVNYNHSDFSRRTGKWLGDGET